MNSKPLASAVGKHSETSQTSWRMMWRHGLAWGGVLALAVVLRLHKLHEVSAWYDEAAAWKTIQFSWTEMFQSIEQNVHPPIYYLVLKLWAGVFGDSPAALRAFSVCCGVITVGLIGLLVREATDADSESSREGWFPLLAAGLYAINPMAIEQAQQARMYTLGILFAGLLGWGTLRVLKNPQQWSGWVLVILFGNLLPLTHYYGFFTSLVAAVVIGIKVAEMWQENSVEVRNAVWARFGMAILVTLPVWIIWGPVFYAQHARVQAAYWIPPFSASWSEPLLYGAEWVSSPWVRDWGQFASIQLSLVSAVAAVFIAKSPARVRWVIAGFALAPPVLSTLYSLATRNLLQGRYWSFAHLFLIVGIVIAVRSLSNVSVQRGLAAALIGWSLLWVVNDRGHRHLMAEQSGLRGVGETLRIVRLPGEPVLVASPFFHPSLQWSQDSPDRIYVPDSGGAYSHYEGGAILRKAEILSLAAPLASPTHRLWVLADDQYSHSLEDLTKLPLPPGWKLGQTFKFFEGNRLPSSLELREYVRVWP
jgi:mannosyltransferase